MNRGIYCVLRKFFLWGSQRGLANLRGAGFSERTGHCFIDSIEDYVFLVGEPGLFGDYCAKDSLLDDSLKYFIDLFHLLDMFGFFRLTIPNFLMVRIPVLSNCHAKVVEYFALQFCLLVHLYESIDQEI
jgi:hypothetical protein